MTALHATEAPTPYLSLFARMGDVRRADVDAALYEERRLVKQLGMRRTLFVVPLELLPAVWGSAARRVADAEWRRLARAVVASGIAADGDRWLAEVRCTAIDALAGGPLSTSQLRERVPALAERITLSASSRWGGPVSTAPYVVMLLTTRGDVVRGRNDGDWRVSRPMWHLAASWLPEALAPRDARESYAELVGSWLRTFGPGTLRDIVWWLGSTVGDVRRALADIGAVEVELASGTGWVLPDDLEPVADVEPWATLLPILDPTVMGWKERDFYLGAHADRLFDTAGNAGTTAWWDGRVVGAWVQDDDGAVELRLIDDVGTDGVAALEREAERLTRWLGGQRVFSVYTSPQMKDR